MSLIHAMVRPIDGLDLCGCDWVVPIWSLKIHYTHLTARISNSLSGHLVISKLLM